MRDDDPTAGAAELCPSRRTVLRGVAALGVVLAPGLLAACSDGGSTAAGTADAGARVPVADVPVGQARVVQAGDQRVVVAQPTDGEFVAFSASCTHQGTTVAPEDGLVLRCPNHGSRFDAGDGGAVVNGPATAPLPAVTVTVEGDELVLG
ncbi:MAG: ubiquinol-cytochrome c reductase iron-sulfur subunit [Actinomycetes bacterium]